MMNLIRNNYFQNSTPFTLQKNGLVVTGVLTYLPLGPELLKIIKPHEKTDPIKVRELTQFFLQGGSQNLPILLGRINKKEDTEELLIMDGHHRFESLKQLHHAGHPQTLFAWIVPFKAMKISSFIKICIPHSDSKLKVLLSRNFKFKQKALHLSCLAPYEIYLVYQGEHFGFQTDCPFSFLDILNQFEQELENNAWTLKELIDSNKKSDSTELYFHPEHLYLSHTPFTHKQVLQYIQNNQLLPRHSTCFSPKPD